MLACAARHACFQCTHVSKTPDAGVIIGLQDVRVGSTVNVAPRVMLFPNYLYYKLSQASSAMVNQVVEVRN
jgi:hypothetical protein